MSREKSLVKNLVNTLTQTVGNKRYIRDLEKLLEEKLTDLSPFEAQTIQYLINDLKFSNNQKDQNEKRRWY